MGGSTTHWFNAANESFFKFSGSHEHPCVVITNSLLGQWPRAVWNLWNGLDNQIIPFHKMYHLISKTILLLSLKRNQLMSMYSLIPSSWIEIDFLITILEYYFSVCFKFPTTCQWFLLLSLGINQIMSILFVIDLNKKVTHYWFPMELLILNIILHFDCSSNWKSINFILFQVIDSIA